MTAQEELSQRLSQCPALMLQEVLTSNGIYTSDEATAQVMADRLAAEIWKHSHTPIGEWVMPSSLEDILDIYAQKLEIDIPKDQHVWGQLQSLREALIQSDTQINIDDLPDDLKERLQRSVVPRVMGASAAGGAAGARWAALKVLQWTSSRWLDLIKLLPQIGPAIIAIRGVAGFLARVSGPVGIALALWSVNDSFGPKWDRCLGLLLGAALCLQDSK